MAVKHNLVEFEGQSNITVVLDGEMYVADNTHPNWTAILNAVLTDEEEGLVELFDIRKSVTEKFRKVSERVSVEYGKVLFDGDVVDNSLTEQIVRFMDEGVDDWKPLVAFMEKVQTNPKKHSRKQLYDFLANNAFTITDEGDILGYKGFEVVDAEQGIYRSIHSGEAFVNGEKITGYIVQKVGDLVEMPRSAVTFDPNEGCSYGLHVSNYAYSKSYGNVVMMVKLNPRDVVSVPKEHSWQKVRCCRYVNLGLADGNVESAVYVSKHAAPTVVEPEPEDETPEVTTTTLPWVQSVQTFTTSVSNAFNSYLSPSTFGLPDEVDTDVLAEDFEEEDDDEDGLEDSWDDDGGYYYPEHPDYSWG